MELSDDKCSVHVCVCTHVFVCQLVDKLNTDSNISDMQMDYSDVSCSVIVTLA